MKLTIFGTGYVGLVTGTCFAALGHDILCVDIDKKKIDMLKKGEPHFYEPGLAELLKQNIARGRINFSMDAASAVEYGQVIFICVGTPQKSNGSANLDFVYNVALTIAANIKSYKLIVDKSTVPVGTARNVKKLIETNIKDKAIEFDVCSNPEFLREGAAVKDFQNPDRIVVGADSRKARQIMTELYMGIARATRPLIFTKVESAEMIKYASNAMLACRISFMNELSHLAEVVGADIKEIAKGMGYDTRIGPRFLQAGCGYGGSCFPKDIRALAATLEHHNLNSDILRSIDYVNERQKKSLFPKLKKHLPSIEGKRIAVWGLTFKPRTDDCREASSLTIVEQLQKEGAIVVGYDPQGMENFNEYNKTIEFADDMYSALKDAYALILVTEWDDFRNPDFERMSKLMKGKIIIDGRNLYTPSIIIDKGFKYESVGR
ncbi:UDP-glucose/GDP-mannose dehydrogenase family protein [Candidatus Woesearchaeota archaeon]|nr:UDP-glucose/GDP-mannose dehydrogenase family protein [Candidatus Woesearchaeota archaeon]